MAFSYFRPALIADLANVPHDAPRSTPVPLSPDARAELKWWRDSSAELLTRQWPWSRLATATVYRARFTDPPTPSHTAATDASTDGVGIRRGPPGSTVDDEPLPSWLPPDSPSTARELYGLARAIETGRYPAGSVVRLITDASSAMHTWAGATCTARTARAARRLFRASMDADVHVIVDWAPREELEDCDAGSRRASARLVHATPPRAWLHQVMTSAFGRPDADVELFASAHNRMFPGARHGSRAPDPSAPIGDGLSAEAWSSARRGWAFPPFGLARAVLHRITTSSSPPRVACLMPDNAVVRTTLARRGWRIEPGPSYLYAPPSFTRRLTPPTPLIACLPPRHGRVHTTAVPRPPGAAVGAGHGHTAADPALLPAGRSTAPAVAGAAASASAAAPAGATWSATYGEVRRDLWAVWDADRGSGPKAVIHCVGSDLAMGAGFALQVRERYGRPSWHGERAWPAVLFQRVDDDSWIVHLVTKGRSSDVPTESAVASTIRATARALRQRGFRRVYAPRIACGLDGHRWHGPDGVAAVVQAAFADPLGPSIRIFY